MIQTFLLILLLIQLKFTFSSIKACFLAEATKGAWQQIGVLFIGFTMIAYVILTKNIAL